MIKYTRNILVAIAAFFLVGAIASITQGKIEKLKEVKYEDNNITVAVREQQLECLARNIYHEAGSEPFEGKVAVAQVTLNRASSGQFPNDICRVIYQKTVVYDKVICQFSWYCETASRVKPIHNTAYRESQEVAKKVLLEGFRLPSLNNAMYYHATYVNPKWNRTKIAQIGNHIFYK